MWNITDYKTAPFRAGLVNLTDEEKSATKTELHVIADSFEPTDEQPICDTFYLTAAFNRENFAEGRALNGDTVEYLLDWTPENAEG